MFELHRWEQMLDVAQKTTPAERFQWLEEMLRLAAPHLKDRLFRRRAVPAVHEWMIKP